MDKQTGKLIARIAENLPDMGGKLMQSWIDNPRALQEFLQGFLSAPKAASDAESLTSNNLVVLTDRAVPTPAVSVPKPRKPDHFVTVDRTVPPSYPEWMKDVMFPEFELAGPGSYHWKLDVERWLNERQRDRRYARDNGTVVFEELIRTDTLKKCMNLQDMVAIQQQLGVAAFQRLQLRFLFWKSVVRWRGEYYVPYLHVRRGEVENDWQSIGKLIGGIWQPIGYEMFTAEWVSPRFVDRTL